MNYDGTEVDISVSAEDYYVSATINIEGPYSSCSGSVQVTGYYYMSRYDEYAYSTTKSSTISDNQSGVTARIDFDESDIYLVHKAVGRYRATIVLASGTVKFAPADLTAVYYTM